MPPSTKVCITIIKADIPPPSPNSFPARRPNKIRVGNYLEGAKLFRFIHFSKEFQRLLKPQRVRQIVPTGRWEVFGGGQLSTAGIHKKKITTSQSKIGLRVKRYQSS